MFEVVLIGLAMNVGLPAGTALTLAPAADTVPVAWVIDTQAAQARYRVREQLAGFDFPNDAVGTTTEVSGTIVMAPDGRIQAEGSEIRVDLASLATDNQRRDGYVRRRTLEVEEYPEAILVPRRVVGLEGPLPESGSRTFQLEADLTLHGHTNTLTWDVMATFAPDTITGLATTAFTFDTFQIAVPSVARVLSVADNIRLELEFRLVPK
ncbi:MAG: YceI family protein [Gemmatimonadetes bacterium]|nr:YceI family protein [Gemmatimonadota bacterium]NNM07025.1 YceI family protein [Gemmatimonadota bacterium]